MEELFKQGSKLGTAYRAMREYVEPTLSFEDCLSVSVSGNQRTLVAALVMAQLAKDFQPITLRGLFYRAVSAGLYPNTSDNFYDQAGRIVLRLRRAGVVPFDWIIDSTRRRLKPSSWPRLRDFIEAVTESYRLDFWRKQRHHVEVFVEKDAMAGVIEPVTEEYDVNLNVVRGDSSETFLYNIAEEWKKIEKPIHVYYLGDHDPAGLRIEASLKSKLSGFVEKGFDWQRLAITPEDFANAELLGFNVKRNGAPGSWKPYIDEYGDRCVEVDAIPPDEIRQRVQGAIESHIDQRVWKRSRGTERREVETFKKTIRRAFPL
jgi:hypothetical protein